MKIQNKLIFVTIIAFLMGLILGIIILINQNNLTKENKFIVEEQPQIKIISQNQQNTDYLENCYNQDNYHKKITPRPKIIGVKDITSNYLPN